MLVIVLDVEHRSDFGGLGSGLCPPSTMAPATVLSLAPELIQDIATRRDDLYAILALSSTCSTLAATLRQPWVWTRCLKLKGVLNPVLVTPRLSRDRNDLDFEEHPWMLYARFSFDLYFLQNPWVMTRTRNSARWNYISRLAYVTSNIGMAPIRSLELDLINLTPSSVLCVDSGYCLFCHDTELLCCLVATFKTLEDASDPHNQKLAGVTRLLYHGEPQVLSL